MENFIFQVKDWYSFTVQFIRSIITYIYSVPDSVCSLCKSFFPFLLFSNLNLIFQSKTHLILIYSHSWLSAQGLAPDIFGGFCSTGDQNKASSICSSICSNSLSYLPRPCPCPKLFKCVCTSTCHVVVFKINKNIHSLFFFS